ncbi:hypothetical protein U1708_07820 [Sphingomonas sp. ZB1N12]|uniref:hypothetical protein n=1 Tax=Sphingomonas arabinosi TaxID=3096160 RepID=UPI002FCC4262
MSNQHTNRRSNVINEKTIKGSGVDGIIEIIAPEEIDAVAGGLLAIPPTTYPGQPPLPNSPVYSPH